MSSATPPSVQAIDLESFDPSPEDYRPSESFMRDRKSKFKGIFTGDVIESCFDGEPEFIENHTYDEDYAADVPEKLIRLVGELHECYFGLMIDPIDKTVVNGQVLQVNPVQANLHGPWDGETVQRMGKLAKNHEGKVWNAHRDPRIGNKQRWKPDDQYDDRPHQK